MKRSLQIFSAATFILLLSSGCTQIKLTKSGGANSSGSSSSPPPVNGDWTVSFMYGENPFESNITFTQKGKALSGQGVDAATGNQFFVQNGSIDGTHVHFTKKYADMDPNKPPVDYSGDLVYENDEDYRGWRMGGHYKTAINGQAIDDKWVAVPAAAGQASAQPQQQPEPVAQQPEQQPEPSYSEPPADSAPSKEGPNISGQWNATYQFNFKKINSKLWLEQDGHQVVGHGVDTNTNERFTVSKGFYYYPRVTLICKYAKGKQAAASRDLVLKAQLQNGLYLKGETQFGGGWQAKIVR